MLRGHGKPLLALLLASVSLGATANPSSIGMDADGDHLVTWQATDGSSLGIFAQRRDADGATRRPAFRVNSTTAGSQAQPALSMDAAGRFVVAWESDGQDGSGLGVYAQRFSADGVTRGGEFRVNTATGGAQSAAAVAVDADGDFVIVWQSDGQDGSGLGVYGQRYDSAGVAQGGEFRVNTATANAQARPAVAMDAAGNFVVAWHSDGQDGSGLGIYAQRFDAAGVAQGGEFPVNVSTSGSQGAPAVALDADGDFIVAWRQEDGDQGVYARRFSAAGVAQGGELVVNADATGYQGPPDVAADAAGGFALAWQADGAGGSGLAIYAQEYSAAAVPQGGPVTIESVASPVQGEPSIAMDADRDFAVAWERVGQAGSTHGHYLARTHAVETVDLALASGQSVVPEPGYSLRNGQVTYTYVVTNTNAVQPVTGVPALDAQIGSGLGVRVLVDPPGGPNFVRFAGYSGIDWTCVPDEHRQFCRYAEALPPTASSTELHVTWTMPDQTTTVAMEGRAIVNQPDPVQSNDYSYQNTPVCNPPGTDAFQVTGGSVPEAAGTHTVRVERQAGACGAVSQPYSLAGLTATPGSDFTPSSGTLTWADGDFSDRQVIVTVLNDALDEANETFRFVLSGGAASTVTIEDDDPAPTVQLTSGNPSIAEAGGTATITATLSAISGRTVTVPLVRSGSATFTRDYGLSAAAIVIPAGSTAGSITLSAVSDSLDEPNESAMFTIGSPTGAIAAGTPRTITISDDDAAPSVAFSSASSSAKEGGAASVVQVRLSAASGRSVTVKVNAVGGTASINADYQLRDGGNLTIPAGTTAVTAVLLLDDTAGETSETAHLALSAPANANLGAQTTHTLSITDNEPKVHLATASQGILESGSTATITAVLSAAASHTVTVPLVRTGTAVAIKDFAQSATSIVIPAGSTSGSVTVNAAGDSIDEDDETIILTIGSVQGASVSGTASNTVTILDDDPAPTVAFEVSSTSASEGGTLNVVAVILSATSGKPVSVSVAVTGGTASQGSDYQLNGGGTLLIPAGQGGARAITVINDSAVESPETVTLVLSAPGNASLGGNTTHALTITSND